MREILGAKVTLRPARETERRLIYEWLACSDITSWLMGPPRYPDVPPPTWEEFSRDYVPWLFDASREDAEASYIIEAAGEAVGQVNYEIRKEETGRLAELDIWMRSEAHTGRGYGPDALNAMIEHLARTYGVDTFVIRPSARNPRAIRAYEKAGFSLLPMTQDEQTERFGPGDYSDTVSLVRHAPPLRSND